jgi:3-phenylpropionate/trans-cinnamate dioxygenase ferredoxin subunit
MAKHFVGRIEEIPPGSSKIIEAAGRSIGIFNVQGEFFALRNRCPHQGGPLCLGQVSGLVRAAGPGVYDISRGGEILRCPWHGWEFDIRTGRSYFDPQRVRVRRYNVTVEEEADAVEVPSVETFPVTIERQNILVEVDS